MSDENPYSAEKAIAHWQKLTRDYAKVRDVKDPTTDDVLNSCKASGGECSLCSVMWCPHQDPMHFHHDGCPACAMEDEA